MQHVIKAIVDHWHLGSAHYWHLRLLCSISLGPTVGVMYLLIFGRRKRS